MWRTSRTRALLLLAAGLMALLGPEWALAHAKLVSATPGPDSTVTSPQTIRLVFNEALTKPFCSLKLTDTDGDPVSLTRVTTRGNSELQAAPPMPLAPGLYTVSWVAVTTDDGHRVSGSFSFTVKSRD
jgi:copper resistance protein C